MRVSRTRGGSIPDGVAWRGPYRRAMTPTTPVHVVIAGGGIAAVEAMMALRDLGEDRVTVTLLAPERDFELKPLRTAEPFVRDHVRRCSVAQLAAEFGAELHVGALAGVDTG